MPRLVREHPGSAGAVVPLGPAEIARTRHARRRGLLGRDRVDIALVLRPCRQVHTIGMRIPIDIIWCDARGQVLRAARVPPGRITRPVRRSRTVVEADAGAIRRWGVVPGQVLRVEED